MTVEFFIKTHNIKVYNLAQNCQILSGYAGDLLSNVMANAQEGCLWFTIMTNVNVAAVASLTGAAAVIICEGFEPEPALLQAAKAKDITLLGANYDIYNAIKTYSL